MVMRSHRRGKRRRNRSEDGGREGLGQVKTLCSLATNWLAGLPMSGGTGGVVSWGCPALSVMSPPKTEQGVPWDPLSCLVSQSRLWMKQRHPLSHARSSPLSPLISRTNPRGGDGQPHHGAEDTKARRKEVTSSGSHTAKQRGGFQLRSGILGPDGAQSAGGLRSWAGTGTASAPPYLPR